ncbi:MAG: glycosyltransferase family 2 protein [Helicobacteraceae bacterium]|jgi:glycosyltransferase involved in cell wall biosynthesis|nr:glycosyltransferase family 2 protein [Helicobacteraceae bacterium]
MGKIAVIIPCYNEARTIEKVVKDFKTALPTAEIFVYDNNSTDDTAEIALKAGAIVRRERRQGKGAVVRSQFLQIDADCYILVDGDDTYPADRATEMSEIVLEKRIDMVIGDRLSSTYAAENKRPFHGFGNWLVCSLINALFVKNGEPISDVMTGYRAFSRLFVKSFPALSQGFEIETAMTIHALDKRLSIHSIAIDYRDRPVGSASKLNTFKDGARVLITIFNALRRYRPLQFFGFTALLLIVSAAALFAPVFFEYIRTGVVPRFPTLITSGFLALCGVISFFCGLILDAISQNGKEQFELYFRKIYSPPPPPPLNDKNIARIYDRLPFLRDLCSFQPCLFLSNLRFQRSVISR